MNRIFLFFISVSLAFAACKNEAGSTADAASADEVQDSSGVQAETEPIAETDVVAGDNIGAITKLAPGMDKYLSVNTPVQVLATGFDWVEGPVWVEELDALLFSDIPKNTVLKWTEDKGVETYLTPSGYTKSAPHKGEMGSNGLLLDAKRRLVLCQHGDRRVARMEAPIETPEAKFVTLAGEYDGKELNSPNDAIYDTRGRLYFTDPPYGLEGGVQDSKKRLKFQGVYRFSFTGVELLDNSLSRPNGIALSPDEKTLYVANSDVEKAVWVAYDINEEGKLRNGRFILDATKEASDQNMVGLPDGMVVMEDGTIFGTGPGGVWIFTPDGTVLGKINLDNPASNVTVGGPKGKSLFITNDMHLLRVRLK